MANSTALVERDHDAALLDEGLQRVDSLLADPALVFGRASGSAELAGVRPAGAARGRPGPGALDGVRVLVGEDDDVEVGAQVGLLLLRSLDVVVVEGLVGDAHVVEDVAGPALVHVAAPGLEETDAGELDRGLGEAGDVVDVEHGQAVFLGQRGQAFFTAAEFLTMKQPAWRSWPLTTAFAFVRQTSRRL